MTYDYVSVEKSIKVADEGEGVSHTITTAENHCNSPKAQKESPLPDDYTYAEVNKISKPSLDTDKSMETTASQVPAVATQCDEIELPYLYATVNIKQET